MESRKEAVINQLIKHDVAVVSTLDLMSRIGQQKADVAETLKTVELAYVNPGISESTFPSTRVMGWLPDVNIYRLPEDYPENRKAGNQTYWKAYAQASQILFKTMVGNGVKVLAGTDANVPVMVPGFSLHEELQSMTQFGMSEAQALRSATALPAEWMKLKKGKIKLGYQADLLLLNANPLIDIKNTQAIDTVINHGRSYNRAQLDSMLKAVKQANDSSREKPIDMYN